MEYLSTYRFTPAEEQLFRYGMSTPAELEALSSLGAASTSLAGAATSGGGGGSKGGGSNASGFFANMGLGLAIGQAFGDIYGAFVGSKTLKATQKGQAQIAKNNAESMQMAVEMSLRQGEAVIGKLTRKAGQTKATQRTRAAANGIAVGVGNNAEIMATTDLLKEADMKTAQLNAIAQSFGYQGQQASYLGRSSALDIMGSANGGMALGNAISAGLTGAGRVASYWTAWKGGR